MIKEIYLKHSFALIVRTLFHMKDPFFLLPNNERFVKIILLKVVGIVEK